MKPEAFYDYMQVFVIYAIL